MGLPYHQVVRKNAGPEARAGQGEGRSQGTTRAVRGPGQAAAGLSEKNEEGGESGIPQRRQSAGGNVLPTSVRKAFGKNRGQTCRGGQEIGSGQTGNAEKRVNQRTAGASLHSSNIRLLRESILFGEFLPRTLVGGRYGRLACPF